MANQVILKKSSVAARVPVAGDLAYGELALNYADGILYFKKPDNSISSISTGSGGGGTVTTLSVASANGFAGTVATATSTPVITLTTSITGLLKGNGTAISAATAGTDYQSAQSVTGIVKSSGTTRSAAVAGTDYIAPYVSQTANYVLAAPSGNAGVPTFRALTATDIPTLNQSTTGSAGSITTTAAIGTPVDVISAVMASTDGFRLRVGDSGSNNGWVELATTDDGNEGIYIRQYQINYGTLRRELALFDTSGNTSIPGNLTVGGTLTITGASGTINGNTIVHAGNFSSYTVSSATTATTVSNTAPLSTPIDLVTATMAANDTFRIRVGDTGSNNGWVEFAVSDDANEAIYVRQYNNAYGSVTRQLTLLDGSGNTTLPGALIVGDILTVTGASGTINGNTIIHAGNLSSYTATTATTATTVTGSLISGTATADLVTGIMGDNDVFRIRVGATATDGGWVEIATGDNGNEPIYIRQYTTSGPLRTFSNITRTLTLLDASGNTSIPGTLTVSGASGTINGSTIIHAGNLGSYVAAKATILETTRAIYGNNFDGSAALTQIIAATYGGTGNGFTEFTGPTTAKKTFTLPDASATILTTNALVTGAQGGTGVNNGTKTITLGGNLTTSGAFTTTLTVTANTSVTLPTSGTLVNTDVATLSSLTTIGTLSSLFVSGTTTLATGLSGLLKATSGVVSTATSGTDYQAPLPSQTGNGGKYLTTDGTSLSWETVTGGGSGNAISVLDEGVETTTALTSINFTGSGVTATSSGSAVTVTISGTGGGGASAISDLTDVTITGTPTNGSFLKYDTTTSQWINVAPTSMVTRTYAGTGAQTGFTVTAGLSVDSVIVTENGIVQVPGTDYTIASTTLTFTTAPVSGTIIQIRELTAVTTVQNSGATIGKAIAMAMIFGG